MTLLSIIRPRWFFAAFAIGLLYCYMTTPPPEVVVRFPSPYNAGKVVYKDAGDACFTYDAAEVDCPGDRSLIKPQPISGAM